MTLTQLPLLNASLNLASASLLVLGLRFIRQDRRLAHRRCMLAALTTSCLFLIGYLTYHYQVGHTRFTDPAWFRPIYLGLLLTHVLLAVVIVPLVLITLYLALRGQFDRHKGIARWTWPIWMYVSVTGVIIYLLLYHIFPQQH